MEEVQGDDLLRRMEVEAAEPERLDSGVHEIPSEWCHRCGHLSAPPELSCDRDDTELLGFGDNGGFVVKGCSKVETGVGMLTGSEQ